MGKRQLLVFCFPKQPTHLAGGRRHYRDDPLRAADTRLKMKALLHFQLISGAVDGLSD